MSTDLPIDRKYTAVAIRFGGEDLIPIEYAEQFVNDYSELRIAIVGIDFFLVDHGTRKPRQTVDSVDLSSRLTESNWDEIVSACKADCVAVIQRERDNGAHVFCSFTIVPESEWKE